MPNAPYVAPRKDLPPDQPGTETPPQQPQQQ
jgi:hypothetical protein